VKEKKVEIQSMKKEKEETGSRFYDGGSENSPTHPKQALKMGDTSPAKTCPDSRDFSNRETKQNGKRRTSRYSECAYVNPLR